MSDFDDEPIEGSRSTTDGEEELTAPSARPRRRPRREDDDVWDDEPAPAAARAKRPRPAADEWDDEEPARPARGRARPVEDDEDWDDDWDDDPGGGKRDLTLVFAIIAAVLVIALVVVLTRPKDDDKGSDATDTSTPSGQTTPPDAPPNKNWQGPVGDAVGEAQARVGNETGVFLWTDFGGWHLRNTSGQEVTVVITAPKVAETVDGSPKGDFTEELTLTLPSGDGATGSDFDLSDSETASISVKQGETVVPADQIKLGGGSGVAPSNPVELTKA